MDSQIGSMSVHFAFDSFDFKLWQSDKKNKKAKIFVTARCTQYINTAE